MNSSTNTTRTAFVGIVVVLIGFAEWIDSAVPAAGARRWLLQHLSEAIPGEPAHAAQYCRAVSTLAERLVREAEHPADGGSGGSHFSPVEPFL